MAGEFLERLAAVGCVGGLSGLLLWAGLEKFRAQRSFDATLTALSVPPILRPLVRVGIPAAEITVAFGLFLMPTEWWPRLGVVALGVAFAVAGVLATRSNQPVSCSCLGSHGGTNLGWRQVALLPAWVGAAAIVTLLAPGWSSAEGAEYLAATVIVMGVIRVVTSFPVWRREVGTRKAMAEAFASERSDG